MDKLYDLKREIELRRKEQCISKIADLNLRKWGEGCSELYEEVNRKVADDILKPLVQESDTGIEAITKLTEFVSLDDNIKVSFDKNTYSVRAVEYSTTVNVIRSRNYTRYKTPTKEFVEDSGIYEVKFSDSYNDECVFYTSAKIPLGTKLSKAKYYTRGRRESIFVLDVFSTLAQVYIANQIYLYLQAHRSIAWIGFMYGVGATVRPSQIPGGETIAYINKYRKLAGFSEIKNSAESDSETTTWKPFSKWLTCLKEKKNFLNLNSIYKLEEKFSMCIHNHIFSSMVYSYLNDMFRVNSEINNEARRIGRISEDYATSYETKKNIPLKIQAAMTASSLNDSFGYTEYDEGVDLEKMEQVELEFTQLKEVVPVGYRKDCQLRFRRLGKHKAGGLFFPHAKCVCVDTSSPSSMCHELLHMIDYSCTTSTKYSDLQRFRPLAIKYIDLVEEHMKKLDDGAPTKSVFEGKTKYNKSYYFSYAEIFARLGEVYVNKKLELNNSLINEVSGVYYPSSKEVLDLITPYYKAVFQNYTSELSEVKEDVSVEDEIKQERIVASPKVNISKVPISVEDNPFDMFKWL